MTKPIAHGRDHYRVFRPLTTRWMDNDVYGHLNNVVYHSLFDTVVNAFLIERGLVDPHGGETIGLVVSSRCHYFSPLAFPEEIIGGLRVEHIGSSSVSYGVGIFAAESDTAAAQGGFIHVYVNRETRKPRRMDVNMREVLQSIA